MNKTGTATLNNWGKLGTVATEKFSDLANKKADAVAALIKKDVEKDENFGKDSLNKTGKTDTKLTTWGFGYRGFFGFEESEGERSGESDFDSIVALIR